ncbi:hypothetical protein A1D23_00035 [Chelonobacter oris]|uniref:ShlB/FhaC/HecB family hemolysin secretion/activation protein n=1 Tax=Chelonobacter oris TaxID=505317 RepID=UPI0024497885|nr:ShlB/FhaC/HecB family hemolysin secretion/activation protein [Chelonobacter oris]MDH2999956.1 hypothetical protein [Chelonobacter oris]
MKSTIKSAVGKGVLPFLIGMPFSVAAEIAVQHEQSLRDSEREIQQQIEQNRYQQLSAQKDQSLEESSDEALSTHCLPINGVQLSGITLLDKQDLAGLSPIPGDCINDENVNRLVRELTQRYLDKGYITTRVVFAPLDENNTLRLHVVEGVLEAIESDDDRFSVGNVFPNMQGNALNIRDLDQGLDQLNRLQSNQVTLDIVPGTKFGSSILRLKNQRKSPYHVSFSVDNYGNRRTGRTLGRIGLSVDNFSGHSDFLSLNHSRNLTDRSIGYNRTSSALYFIPYGYWTASLFASQAESSSLLPLSGARYNGSSRQIGARLDRVLSRDQRKINTLSIGLSHKQSRSELLGYRHPDQNIRLSVVDLSFDQLRVLENGTLTLNLGIQKGLGIFGASAADSGRLTEPHFMKWSASADWQYSMTMAEKSFQMNHHFAAQYSRDRPPSMETFDLTGRHVVRGFDELSLSSDSGWYLRNTLSYPISYGAVRLAPYIGIDAGRLFNRKSTNAWQSAVGTSFGIRLGYQQLSGSFSFDRGWFVSSPGRQNESRFLGKITLYF